MPSAAPTPSNRESPLAHTRGRTGVVVCGGKSRRMGVDKAGLTLGGQSLLERALAALRPVCDEVLLATGASARYAEHGVRIVLDRGPDLGPLAGLEAALAGARHERVLLLAVDMPAVESDLLQLVCERAEREDHDALMLGSERVGAASGARFADVLGADMPHVEPLCGVYHTRLLPAVRAALDAGERRMVALFAHPLDDGRAARLAVLDPGFHGAERATRNVNTRAEWARARSEWTRAGADRTHARAELGAAPTDSKVRP